MNRREGGGSEGGVPASNAVGAQDKPEPAPQLRAPRHGGWKGSRSAGGREAQMLRGEPGYHLGLFRIGYGVLLVQRTLAFMSSGAVDASFVTGESPASSPGGVAPKNVINFGHGFLLLGGELGSPTADAVRTACWCLCAAGAAISVGFRPNAMAFAASLMQLFLLLLEKSVYTDEAYLFALVGLLLSCTDCGKTLGLDAPVLEEDGAAGNTVGGGGRGGVTRSQPPDTVPHWHVVLLRFQVCIVHIHRGLAKASTLDWLVGGQPLLHTLETLPPAHLGRRAAEWAAASEIPGLGGGGMQALAIRANGSMIFLDLFLGLSLLASPHYRPAAVVLQTAVHLASAVFGRPDARAWHLLIVATGVLFVDPAGLQGAIERVQAWLQPKVPRGTSARYAAGARRGRGGGVRGVGRRRPYESGGTGGGTDGSGRSRAGGDGSRHQPGPSPMAGTDAGSNGQNGAGVAAAVGDDTGLRKSGAEGVAPPPKKKLPLQPRPSSPVAALISLYVLLQVLLPLRHALGVFPVEWSREGHEFSWRAGGGVGGRGGGGGLVREESLVRVMHRPRGRDGGQGRGSAAAGVQTIRLYGAPLTAQQVLRLVLDPDMLLQFAKKTAEINAAAGHGHQQKGKPQLPAASHVDAWKSINGRPFTRWIDPSVDVWDPRFEGEGPPNAEWLQSPPLQAELDRAAGVMEAVRVKWAMKDQRVTFFAGYPGQASLSNIFLGGYDPSNFNTSELCAVPAPPNAEASGSGEGGGVLFGVAMGEVHLMTDPKNGQPQPESRVLTVGSGTVQAPLGQGHTVRPGASSPVAGKRAGGLAVWYYVHSCPDGLFHLCIGFLSGTGWEHLYPSRMGTRRGWTMEHGVPK
ncbi:unnamed protein product [Ectocarpus sp. 13 AM-2016]